MSAGKLGYPPEAEQVKGSIANRPQARFAQRADWKSSKESQ